MGEELRVGLSLTVDESGRLEALEATITAGLQTFVEVGMALAEIRRERLYRAEHKTFEDYCKKRWHISKPHATRLIQASDAVINLQMVPNGTMPANEAQVRPLTSLEPEQQREVWAEAIETAPRDGCGAPKITAAHVERAVRQATDPVAADVLADHGDEHAVPAEDQSRRRLTRAERRVQKAVDTARRVVGHLQALREAYTTLEFDGGMPADVRAEVCTELKALAESLNRLRRKIEGAA